MPLAIMRYSVDLYIPKDWKFNITNSLHANNLHKPEWTKKWGYYDPYYDEDTGRCSDWINYDEKENAFFCPPFRDETERFRLRFFSFFCRLFSRIRVIMAAIIMPISKKLIINTIL